MPFISILLAAAILLSTAVPPFEVPGVEGYQPMLVPAENPMTPGKIALGRRLFLDRRLSGNETLACATCHRPQYALTQGPKRRSGAYDETGETACPSLVNVGHQQQFFWEGSAPTLEKAINGVWLFILVQPKPGRPTAADIAARLNAIPEYRTAFQREFGAPADPQSIVKSLATFLRTLNSNDSAWMRFARGHQTNAITAAARRGYALFDGKALCSNCHSGILLTDLQFHNVGVGSKANPPEEGRYGITKIDRDRGAFKTPSLLNVALTAPYFHDHSVKTLEAAVDQMLGGGIENPHVDRTNLKPVKLSAAERKDLLAFLRSLVTKIPVDLH
jgi:cytochrome c peroxidase